MQLSDLAEYRAATSNFELIIDLENDVKFLPDFVAGERSVMVAAGTVDAKVDFSNLTEQNIVVSEDRKSVTIHLPPPEHRATHASTTTAPRSCRASGACSPASAASSVTNPSTTKKLYVLAEEKLREAAQASQLRDLAEKNTRAMLEALLTIAGFRADHDHFRPSCGRRLNRPAAADCVVEPVRSPGSANQERSTCPIRVLTGQ